jgi:hypothetical protein
MESPMDDLSKDGVAEEPLDALARRWCSQHFDFGNAMIYCAQK